MADTAAESWWIKVGILYDKSGFKGVLGGMLDIKKAATGLYDSFRKVVDVNSDLYNTARYLNTTSGDLQTWERAFRLIGGSAEDARSAISSLNFVYDQLRLGMDSGKAEMGARLGLKPEDFLSFQTMLTSLNRSYNELFKDDYGAFKVLAEQLGLSESAILLVTQSTADFKETLRDAGSIPLIPESQLKAARELDKEIAKLTMRWDVFKAKLVSTSLPGLEKIFSTLADAMDDPKTMAQLEQFFNTIEQGFTELATNKDVQEFIKNVGELVGILPTLMRWGSKGLSLVKSGTDFVGGAVGTAVGALTTRPIEFTPRSFSPVGTMWATDMLGYQPTLTQNITIDGAQSPAAVGQEVAARGKEMLNGHSAMRTVENMRNNTSL